MAGSPDGFVEFVAARQSMLLRSALLLTGDRALAEDLVQIGLLKTWSRWGRLDNPEAYARKVMYSTYVDGWRRNLIAARVRMTAAREGAALDDYDDVDSRDAMLAVLASLPPRQRAVLILRFYEDLTEDSVAEMLGCSVGTVKSQSSRALATLRRRLADSPLEDGRA